MADCTVRALSDTFRTGFCYAQQGCAQRDTAPLIGGENRGIAWFMINHPERGTDRGSMITGRSVHNQRQERLWRDVNHGCTHVFYSLFHYMEEQDILDPTCEEHFFAYIMYLPPELTKI